MSCVKSAWDGNQCRKHQHYGAAAVPPLRQLRSTEYCLGICCVNAVDTHARTRKMIFASTVLLKVTPVAQASHFPNKLNCHSSVKSALWRRVLHIIQRPHMFHYSVHKMCGTIKRSDGRNNPVSASYKHRGLSEVRFLDLTPRTRIWFNRRNCSSINLILYRI